MMEFNFIGYSRNDLKCVKINCSIINCSMFSNYICVCIVMVKWWLDGFKIGFFWLDYLLRLGDSMIVGIELINDDEYDIYFFDEYNSFLLVILNNVCDY